MPSGRTRSSRSSGSTPAPLDRAHHDPKIDDPALHLALKSEVFYIGALGSKKTQASRAQRLKDAGFTESQMARIHGPIGIAIGPRVRLRSPSRSWRK